VTSTIRKAGGGVMTLQAAGGASPRGATKFDVHKLKKRVGWLNTQGGFNNCLLYDKIAEAAAQKGVDESVLFQVLKNLEGKGPEINEPTSWVTAALRKAKSPPPPWAHGDGEGSLRKHIGWLNNHGGFDNKLQYTQIAEAANGLDGQSLLKVLTAVEGKAGSLADPTAWLIKNLKEMIN